MPLSEGDKLRQRRPRLAFSRGFCTGAQAPESPGGGIGDKQAASPTSISLPQSHTAFPSAPPKHAVLATYHHHQQQQQQQQPQQHALATMPEHRRPLFDVKKRNWGIIRKSLLVVVQLPRRVREVRTGSYRFVQCRREIACDRLWDGGKLFLRLCTLGEKRCSKLRLAVAGQRVDVQSLPRRIEACGGGSIGQHARVGPGKHFRTHKAVEHLKGFGGQIVFIFCEDAISFYFSRGQPSAYSSSQHKCPILAHASY